MKKLALGLAIGLFSNFSYGQAWSNEWPEENSIPFSQRENIKVPIMETSNNQEFDSIRLSIHMGIFKYNVYHYDSLEKIQSVEYFDEFPRILNDEHLYFYRYVLIGDNGKPLQMLDLRPINSEL